MTSSSPPSVRRATAADFPAILALNTESVHFLSAMDLDRLRRLDATAAYHRVICAEGRLLAFLLAFREGSDYDSPNYRWFAGRYERFLYIDRIVVSETARGLGLASRLYDDLFAFARQASVPSVTLVACEFDVDPPNPASERFHAGYGFTEVGQQVVAEGKKRVSLQMCALPASSDH